jgi:hypothetical protein
MPVSNEEKRKKKVELFKTEGRDWLKSKESYEEGLTSPEEKLLKNWKSGINSAFSSGQGEKTVIKPGIKSVDKSAFAQTLPRVEENADMDKLSKSIDKLSNNITKDRESPSIKDFAMKNTYDSTDPLINAHASGRLSLSE